MAKRLHRRQNASLMSNLESAVKVCNAAPALAEKQIRNAFRQSKGAAGLAMGSTFENDDPAGKRLCQGEEVRKGMGHIGSLTQEKFKKNGVCPTAWAAFCDVFFIQQPEIEGRDGVSWSLRSELTWEVFQQALNSMGRGKALGADGISIDWLRKAGTWVKKLFFEGLLRCAEEHSFPKEWGQIIYVLLRKKRGDQRLVHKRRDIALMAQSMKLLCKMTHAEAYLRISDSLHRAQVGWLCAHGATDAASSFAHVIQTSARLKLPLFVLYVDLRTFFPALHRQIVTAGELLHGLPREVSTLVAKLFAVATGQYDSKHGLSDSFDIDWGALMGCVLSPDRAKLVLDLAAVAIALICKGAKVWGRADLRRILSILCADDWAGTFNEANDMIAAWEMWKAWACASGCIIGVEELEKTTYSGIAYHSNGQAFEAPCPSLRMNDGSKLARLPFNQVYKHMGFPRRLDGSMAEAVKSFSKSWYNRLHALKRFRLRESDFIRASNIICLGLSSFYGTGLYLSWAECEKLEAAWRNIYNFKFCRCRCSPRFPIYAEQPLPQPDEIKGGRLNNDFGRRDGDLRRIHLYSALSASLLANSFKLLGDSCDSDARAATEQALGLAFHSWGCRVSPERWNPCHVIEAIREYVSVPDNRNLGDCILLVYAECLRRRSISIPPDEQWDFWGFSTGGSKLPQGALHHDSPIWTGFQSQPLFEPLDGGGLGLPVSGALVRAGVVQIGQLCEKLRGGLTGGQFRLCDWEKCVRLFPGLAAQGRRGKLEWRAVTSLISNSVSARMSVDNRPVRSPLSWVEGHQSLADQLVGGVNRGNVSSVDVVRLRAWTHKVVDMCRVAPVQEVDESLRTVLRDELLDCLGDSSPANNSSALPPYRIDEQKAISQGTLLVAYLPHGRILSQGSPSRAIKCRHAWNMGALRIDVEGHVCYGGERVTRDTLDFFDSPVVSAHVNARDCFGDITFICWRKLTHKQRLAVAHLTDSTPIDTEASEEFMLYLLDIEQLHGIDTLYTLDGGWRTGGPEGASESGSCAAIRHCGRVSGGRMHSEQITFHSYQTETGGHLCALEEEVGRRLLCIHDATSPVEATVSFRGKHDRHRAQYLLDDWFAEVSARASKFEVVVDVWAKSHKGLILNEWPDYKCTRFMEGTEFVWFDVPAPAHTSYRLHTRLPIFREAIGLQSINVEQKLRLHSRDTVWPNDSQLHVDLARLPPAVARTIVELRSHRALPNSKACRDHVLRHAHNTFGACGCEASDCSGDWTSLLVCCRWVSGPRTELYNLMASLEGRVGGHAPNPQWSSAQRFIRKCVRSEMGEESFDCEGASDLARLTMGVVDPSQAVDSAARVAMLKMALGVHEFIKVHRERNRAHYAELMGVVHWARLMGRVVDGWRCETLAGGPARRAAFCAMRLGALDAAAACQVSTGESIRLLGKCFTLTEGHRWMRVVVRRISDIAEQYDSDESLRGRETFASLEWRVAALVYRCRARIEDCELTFSGPRGGSFWRAAEGATVARMAGGAAGLETFEQWRSTAEVSQQGLQARWMHCVRAWLRCGGNDVRKHKSALVSCLAERRRAERETVRRALASAQAALVSGLGSNMQLPVQGERLSLSVSGDPAASCRAEGNRAAEAHLRWWFDSAREASAGVSTLSTSQVGHILSRFAESVAQDMGSMFKFHALSNISKAIEKPWLKADGVCDYCTFRRLALAQGERLRAAASAAGIGADSLRLEWQRVGDLAATCLAKRLKPKAREGAIRRAAQWDRQPDGQPPPSSDGFAEWLLREGASVGPLSRRRRLEQEFVSDQLATEKAARDEWWARRFNASEALDAAHERGIACQRRLIRERASRLENKRMREAAEAKGRRGRRERSSRGALAQQASDVAAHPAAES